MTGGKLPAPGEVIKGFYQVAVGHWGIQPSEFWRMTPAEWWWLHELKTKRPDVLTHEDVDDLQRFASETHAQDRR